jgi:hypothetical protein
MAAEHFPPPHIPVGAHKKQSAQHPFLYLNSHLPHWPAGVPDSANFVEKWERKEIYSHPKGDT